MNGDDLAIHPARHAPADGLQRLILRRVWHAPWRHLPTLAVSSVTTAIPVALAMRIAGGSPLLTPLLLALLAGPTLMALLAVVQGALIEDDTDLRTHLRRLRTSALRSTGYSLIPALCLASLIAAIDLYARTESRILLISLGTAIVATVLSISGFMALVPLAVARPELRGVKLWATSWHLVGRWPVRFLAPVVMTGLALWAVFSVSTTLVLLLPAPIALLAGAAYWCCAVELGAEDVFALGDFRRR